MAENSKYLGLLNKSTRGVIISLTIQFILGMVINLYGVAPDDPKYATESPFIKISFLLHGLNGLILPILSLAIVFLAYKSGKDAFKKWALLGFISILVAAAAGISTITLKDNASELASFVMALGFIASFLSYGKLYLALKSN